MQKRASREIPEGRNERALHLPTAINCRLGDWSKTEARTANYLCPQGYAEPGGWPPINGTSAVLVTRYLNRMAV